MKENTKKIKKMTYFRQLELRLKQQEEFEEEKKKK